MDLSDSDNPNEDVDDPDAMVLPVVSRRKLFSEGVGDRLEGSECTSSQGCQLGTAWHGTAQPHPPLPGTEVAALVVSAALAEPAEPAEPAALAAP